MEDFREWSLFDLLLKQVLLVEEEDHRGLQEPLVVQDGVEEPQRFIHSVLLRGREREEEEKRVWKG